MHGRAWVLLLPLAVVVPYMSACEDDHTAPTVGLEDVVYAGQATDEALRDLLALPAPSNGGDKRARFTAPSNGEKVNAAPTFTWTFGTAPTDAGALGSFVTPPHPHPARSHTFVTRLLRSAFPGERQAFAHGEPLNGTAYLLVLSTANNDKLLRVFTTHTSFTPDAAAWEKLKTAGTPVRAVVTTALFENNKVVSGGGPFEGEAVSFEVSP